MTVDTKKYTEFVDAVTSQESKDYIAFNTVPLLCQLAHESSIFIGNIER